MLLNGLKIEKVPIILLMAKLEETVLEKNPKLTGEELFTVASNFGDTLNGKIMSIQYAINYHNDKVTVEKMKETFEIMEPKSFGELIDTILGTKGVDIKKN